MIDAAPPPLSRKGAIELDRICKQYGKDRVVDGVSAVIEPGEFFSLLGPSGSGKTTTLMMIAGFADVDEGRILVDGVDISATPPQRRGFGMVFQNYAIFPHLNVFENVAFPLRARKRPDAEIRQRVDAALGLVRLERFGDRFARQLSGGQQQRVAIARAIVFQPSVVLMDEPLGALDKNLRYQMQVEIKDIQRRLGMTVIYVTHDQEEAMNMSDRIAIMNNGRIEQVGRPYDIYENPASTFIARFLGEANLIEGVVDAAGDADRAAGGDPRGRTTADGAAHDLTVLRTPAGTRLRARAQSALAPPAAGASAHLFIRPERVMLAPISDVPAAIDTVNGRVLRTAFLGNILRHTVEIEPGAEVTVDVQNSGDDQQAGRAVGAGDNVTLSWRVADALVIGQ